MAVRRVGKLCPTNTVLLLCDMQERFRDAIHNFPQVLRTAIFMSNVGKELGISAVATEQYPKAFGKTVPELAIDSPAYPIPVVEKKSFSMWTDELQAKIEKSKVESVLLCGIEAHVCVQQTALDLLQLGWDVHVIVDGVSSQRPFERELALRRMEQSGAFLTTSESATFMLMKTAAHPSFKAVSALIKDNAKYENMFSSHL